MQLTGDRFTSDSVFAGNDFASLPAFPAEIRAPQGTVAGVSSYQLHVGGIDIMTPGEQPDVLVAMNPAALKANLKDLRRGGVLITDTAEFTARNLAKVGIAGNPPVVTAATVSGREGTALSYKAVVKSDNPVT